MKRLMILTVASFALMTSACATVRAARKVGTPATNLTWTQAENAQPFETARTECRAATMGPAHKDAFVNCMSEKGWTRS